MPAWMVPLAIQGGQSLLNYGAGLLGNRSRKKSQNRYLSYLSGIEKNGAYSPEMQRTALAPVARATAQQAQRTLADTRGALTMNGMDNSIAGTRLLAEPGQRRMGILGDASNRLALANAESKVQAQRERQRVKLGFGMENAEAGMQNTLGLVQGLANAGLGAYRRYDYDKHYNDIMGQATKAMEAGDDDMAELLLMQLMGIGGGY